MVAAVDLRCHNTGQLEALTAALPSSASGAQLTLFALGALAVELEVSLLPDYSHAHYLNQ